MQPHPTIIGRDLDYKPPTDALEIIYQDDDLLLVNKPHGLLSVPGKSPAHQDCLEFRVQAVEPNARIVHRLDMATSGIMVLALNPAAHRHLGLQFERRHVNKSYIAHVWGKLVGQTGRIDMPLRCDWPNRPLQMVDFELGKRAQTEWEVLETRENHTVVRLHPVTGRSHQLRVHMRELGCPILGDRLYAPDDAFKATDRLMLHAETLELRHPVGGKTLNFSPPCPF